jgi:hypothetical protein
MNHDCEFNVGPSSAAYPRAISLQSHGCVAMQKKPRSICVPSTMTLLLKDSLN